jgi:hypothetical protein
MDSFVGTFTVASGGLRKDRAPRLCGARVWKSCADVEVRLTAGKLLYSRLTGGAWLSEEEFTAEFREMLAVLENGFVEQCRTEWAARGVGECRQGPCRETCVWEEYEVLVRFPRRLTFEKSLARLVLPAKGWAAKMKEVVPRGRKWNSWFPEQLDNWERQCSAAAAYRGRTLHGRVYVQMVTALCGVKTECTFSEENMQWMLLAEDRVEKDGDAGMLSVPTNRVLFTCSRCRNKGHQKNRCPYIRGPGL